jgi:hypothetical protein
MRVLVITFFSIFLLTACDPQPSREQKIQTYRNSIHLYTCEQLAAEKRINEKMIAAFTESQRTNSNVAGDVLYNTLTLGTDTIEDGRSMSENANERNRIDTYRQRNTYVIQLQQQRCTT